jgi:membrane associated rhomboid family serine protease
MFGSQRIFPPVLKALLIANISIFALQYFIFPTQLNNFLMMFFALWPVEDLSSLSFGNFMPWQLITYQFMHSLSSIMHVGFNMLALWMFGSELEAMWGSKKFLIYYLLCGIGAGLIHLLISPFFSEPLPAIGASGAVYGLLLAFGMTFPDRPIFLFPFFIPIPARIFVIIFAGIELISGISGSDGVAHFAHLGGALTGFILIKFADNWGLFSFFDKFFKPRVSTYSAPSFQQEPKVYKANWKYQAEPRREAPRTDFRGNPFSIDGEEITQNKIDEILDKISASGYQNLTEREKKILFELSQKLK